MNSLIRKLNEAQRKLSMYELGFSRLTEEEVEKLEQEVERLKHELLRPVHTTDEEEDDATDL